jgi:hypothetical protein
MRMRMRMMMVMLLLLVMMMMMMTILTTMLIAQWQHPTRGLRRKGRQWTLSRSLNPWMRASAR